MMDKTLIVHNSQYKKYDVGSWVTITSTIPTEVDYNNGNTLEELTHIPESAWSELDGEVDICFYTHSEMNELSIQVETDSFLLADILKDDVITIKEYSDDSEQAQSIVALATEPFLIYEELGNEMDVLYYTDDLTVESPGLEMTSNYTPLDELDTRYELYSWSSDENISDPIMSIEANPIKQMIIHPEDVKIYGDLQSIVMNKIGAVGTFKLAVSFNSGVTWESCKYNEWVAVNIADMNHFRTNGMDSYDLSKLSAAMLSSKGSDLRIAYYIEDNIHSELNLSLSDVKLQVRSATGNVELSDLVFSVQNTVATIQVTFAGNKLVGSIEDEDQGKVQYRVLLNGESYYPADGNYTSLHQTPIPIHLNMDDRRILIDQDNTLRVEFKDAWGVEDAWETVFVGLYSGLMFKNSTGEYLTNSLGELLKHLDFGVVIAGQTTLEQQVVVKNQLGERVQNLQLEVAQDKLPEGVAVQLSRTASPFRAEESLLFNQIVEPEEELVFYVRLSTHIHAPAAPGGQFEIRAHADAL